MIPYLILTGVLTGSAGWCIGHRTARIRIVVIGATADQDQAALDTLDDDSEQQITEWRQRLDQLVSPFDLPDDPRSDAA